MDSSEIRKLLKQAKENNDWDLIEDVENKIFTEEVIDTVGCTSWLTAGSDFRNYLDTPKNERTKIEFIYLNNWRGWQVSKFLDNNFDRLDEIIYILENWVKDYDKND